MANLTTLTKVKAIRDITVSDDDVILQDCINRASTWIETRTRRTFVAQGNGTLQYTFDADYPTIQRDGRILLLDKDLLSIGTLINQPTGTITADQYRLLPANDSPKYAIELKPSSGLYWSYETDWQDAIQVIGTWGYSTTAPADIEEAAIKVALYLYDTRDSSEGPVQMADGNIVLPKQIATSVMSTLDRYTRVDVKS